MQQSRMELLVIVTCNNQLRYMKSHPTTKTIITEAEKLTGSRKWSPKSHSLSLILMVSATLLPQ